MKKMWITLSVLFLSAWAQAQAMGSLQVQGTAGSSQVFKKVKAVRCYTTQRGGCDNPVFFALGQNQAVPAGTYIVGFENSIHPGLVEVKEGVTTVLHLEKLSVPSQVRGERIRIYRDMSTLVEQRKIYLSMFYMKRHFFRLDKENFGDLYLAGSWERDFVQRFTYEGCSEVKLDDKYFPSSSRAVCSAWKNAREPGDLREMFNFGNDGTFEEMWVTRPGDVLAMTHPRYLVAVPMKDTEFVAVFPGAYKVQAEGKGKTAVSVKVGNASQSGNTFGFSLNVDSLFTTLEGEDCATARKWKTDTRAYCTSDEAEGCDRSSAASCEPM